MPRHAGRVDARRHRVLLRHGDALVPRRLLRRRGGRRAAARRGPVPGDGGAGGAHPARLQRRLCRAVQPDERTEMGARQPVVRRVRPGQPGRDRPGGLHPRGRGGRRLRGPRAPRHHHRADRRAGHRADVQRRGRQGRAVAADHRRRPRHAGPRAGRDREQRAGRRAVRRHRRRALRRPHRPRGRAAQARGHLRAAAGRGRRLRRQLRQMAAHLPGHARPVRGRAAQPALAGGGGGTGRGHQEEER